MLGIRRGSWRDPVDRRQQKDTGAGLRAAPCVVPPGNVGPSTDPLSVETRAQNRVWEARTGSRSVSPGPVWTLRSGITRTWPQELHSQNQKLCYSHRYTESV